MAKRPVPKYDFKAFGAAIKAARTGRKESRKKVSDEMLSCAAFFFKVQNGCAARVSSGTERGRVKASRRRCGLFLGSKREDSHHQFCLQPFPNVMVYAKIDVPALVV